MAAGDARHGFTTEVEPVQQKRLKVEINSREHFTVLGLARRPFEVASRWWAGRAEVATYEVEELLDTKLRALYQRKKGRDLFDLWTASRSLSLDTAKLVRCFQRYLESDGVRVSRAELEANLHGKLHDAQFQRDVVPLLATGTTWDRAAAADYVLAELAPLLPGEAWKGASSGEGA
jgi:predicted nucleotidyltransferase component of viral defense system